MHWRRLPGLLMILCALTILGGPASAQTSGPVYVISIRNQIDLGLAPYVWRILAEAAEARAQAVILEIDTPGGRLDAVLQMRDAILDSSVPTIAFVNRQAFSAGALVAIAANEVYMAPGAVLGAATPVDGAGTTADAKTISAVSSVFRSTAELRDRDPVIAEAMVDRSIAIDGLVSDQQLLTLTTQQAQRVGYADGMVENRQALLNVTGLAGAPVVEAPQNWTETAVGFLTNGAVASLLLALGFLLILADVYTGGFGAVGILGIGLIALFFWGHFLVGLAGWEGVLLVVMGLALIALEVFVLPGFGVAGIFGSLALLGGIFISRFDARIVTTADLVRAGSTVAGMLLLLAGGTVLLIRFLPRTARMQGLILEARVGLPDLRLAPRQADKGRSWLEGDRLEAQSATYRHAAEAIAPQSLRGAVGFARSDLRPGGIAEIAGQRVDVVSRGEYIAAGTAIEVITDEGYRRVVRQIATGGEEPT